MTIPRPVGDEVARPRLVASITESLVMAGAVGVIAPARCGKTVSVAQWARVQERVAWVALGRRACEQQALVEQLVDAIRQIEPTVGGAALLAASTAGIDAFDVALDHVLDDLANVEPITLVLDEVEVLGAAPVGRVLATRLLRTDRVRVVYVGRVDVFTELVHRADAGEPPRLIGYAELVFAVDELRPVLGSERAAAFVESVAGLPGALPMARRGVEPLAADGALVDAARAISATLEPAVRTFASGATVLGEFSAELCAAALERDDVAERLDDLVSLSIVAEPSPDDGWYRLDDLAIRAGRELAEHDEADRVDHIRELASEWCAEHDRPDLALQFAADRPAGDALVVALLRRMGPAWAMASHTETVIEWTSRLLMASGAGAQTTEVRADLLLIRAWAEAQSDRAPELRATLDEVDAAAASMSVPLNAVRRAEVLVLRSHLARRAGRFTDADVLARTAREVASSAPADLAWIGPTGHARVALTEAMAATWVGDVVRARRIFVEALPALVRPTGRAVAISHQALLAWMTDDPSAPVLAAIAAPLVAGEASRGPAATTSLGIVALVAEGAVAERAAAHLEVIAASSGFVGDSVVAGLAIARRQAALGDAGTCDSAMAEVEQEVSSCPQPGILPELVAKQRSRLALSQRPTPSAARFSDSELALLRHLAGDETEREIAGSMYLSYNTVRTYRRRIYRRLGVDHRTAAIERAAELGLLEPAPPPG